MQTCYKICRQAVCLAAWHCCRHSERPAEKLSAKQAGSGADSLEDLQTSCLLSRLTVVQTFLKTCRQAVC